MRLTAAGIAVIDDDVVLSKWVEDEGRLDVACERRLIDQIAPLVPVGGIACDIGASIGDHTTIYANMVGPTGHVYAFEPNPPAFECLTHNMIGRENVTLYQTALGSKDGTCSIARDPAYPMNYGMSTVVAGDGVTIHTLDDYARTWPKLDYLKIDVEGFELAVLTGAKATLQAHRPAILMEVNSYALQNHGTTPEQLYALLWSLGYAFLPVTGQEEDPRERAKSPLFDMCCFPTARILVHLDYLIWDGTQLVLSPSRKTFQPLPA